MKYVKTLVLATSAAALMALTAVSPASATVLDGPEGMLTPGTPGTSEAVGGVRIENAFFFFECQQSVAEGKITSTGGATETVAGVLESLTYEECGTATVTALKFGTQEIHTQEEGSNNNGTVTSNGTEGTLEGLGIHCIFKTINNTIGVLTGSSSTEGNAALDVSFMLPRVGGRSGAFCGPTAAFKGLYKITSPSVENVT